MARPTAITSLQDTQKAARKNWLIYAPSGVGKTVLTGTAPNSLLVTTEAAGSESAQIFGSQADEWVVDTRGELQEAVDYLLRGKPEKDGYEWAGIDGITEMQEQFWKDELVEGAKKYGNRNEFQAQLQDYGIVDTKIKRLVDDLVRAPINTLFTAQMMVYETEDEDGDDLAMRVPAVGRSKNGAPLANLICGKMTMVGLLHVVSDPEDEDEKMRRLITTAGSTWVAKDRHHTFGPWVDKPNIAEMAAAVDANRAKAATKATKKKGKA